MLSFLPAVTVHDLSCKAEVHPENHSWLLWAITVAHFCDLLKGMRLYIVMFRTLVLHACDGNESFHVSLIGRTVPSQEMKRSSCSFEIVNVDSVGVGLSHLTNDSNADEECMLQPLFLSVMLRIMCHSPDQVSHVQGLLIWGMFTEVCWGLLICHSVVFVLMVHNNAWIQSQRNRCHAC